MFDQVTMKPKSRNCMKNVKTEQNLTIPKLPQKDLNHKVSDQTLLFLGEVHLCLLFFPSSLLEFIDTTKAAPISAVV